jgi:hypothetical protein
MYGNDLLAMDFQDTSLMLDLFHHQDSFSIWSELGLEKQRVDQFLHEEE